MKIWCQYTEYPDLPEEATIYSHRRARNGVLLSLLFAVILFLGIVFLLGHQVFGIAGPLCMVIIGVAGCVYLVTLYPRATQRTIDEMRKVQQAARIQELESIRKYKSGESRISNDALRARMELLSNSNKKPEV